MYYKGVFRGILIIVLLSCFRITLGQYYVPGTSYFGRNNYIEYIAGNLPIIISVPHGGISNPSEIADRTCGENVSDSYTISLAREIRDAINLKTGCYPHIIINHLKRSKLDANRDLDEATCGDPYSAVAWNEFHKFIDSAKAIVTRRSGKGLYIDLHGHGHSIQRLEIGYLLTATQLSYSDATLNSTTYKNYSSIRNLIYHNINNLTHAELLRGTFSLGSMIAAKGFPSVPSSSDPYPQSGDLYFNGGYNTIRHGSKSGGVIDGIQIECNQDVRFDEPARLLFASGLSTAMLDYITKHYIPEFPLTYCNPVGVEDVILPQYKIYPNPFDSYLIIQALCQAELKIYNNYGGIVFMKRIEDEEKVDLRHLKEGIYLITITGKGKAVYSEKFIKMIRR
jgi:hypothetical protein